MESKLESDVSDSEFGASGLSSADSDNEKPKPGRQTSRKGRNASPGTVESSARSEVGNRRRGRPKKTSGSVAAVSELSSADSENEKPKPGRQTSRKGRNASPGTVESSARSEVGNRRRGRPKKTSGSVAAVSELSSADSENEKPKPGRQTSRKGRNASPGTVESSARSEVCKRRRGRPKKRSASVEGF